MLAIVSTLMPALHEWPVEQQPTRGCVSPGRCTPPATNYSRVILGPVPGQQWNINGGFCGAFSIQHAALAQGAWISQDLVRKANKDQPVTQPGHGDSSLGYEILPINAPYSAKQLGLAYEAWDYTQPAPQAAAYKAWLKRHLAAGHAVVWFPMCKGDSHTPYPGSCPNGGHLDHVEAMYGLYSEHPLDDPTVYDTDWIVHTSDQDYEPYYRTLASLDDTSAMEGNCLHAQPGFGRNEMYPCFDSHVTYGLAVTGLAVHSTGTTYPVALSTSGAVSEPNVRTWERPSSLHANVTVSGLTPGETYTLWRYDGTANLPPTVADAPKSASHRVDFTAPDKVWTFADAHPFMSNTAVYYLATQASVGKAA